GLVRYHGRPGASYIKPFVCVITPDADDTALAWRLAPARDGSRLRSALRVLAAHRRPDGLYRTWLTGGNPPECLDPARDPNPADGGMTIHLSLSFARYEPAAARPLCEALRRDIGEPGIWVYYEAAPLLPFLREADLAAAGCPVRVPEARLRTAPAGQE